MTKRDKADRPERGKPFPPEEIRHDPQGGGYYWGGQSYPTYDEALAAAEAGTDGIFKKGE